MNNCGAFSLAAETFSKMAIIFMSLATQQMRQKNWWPCPESVSQPNSGVRFPTKLCANSESNNLCVRSFSFPCYRLSILISIILIVSPLNIELGQHIKEKLGKARLELC